MTGSSILPVAIYKNKLYFLFGKENELEKSAKGFSDFGGGIERGETPLETACREGAEELTGFLGPIQLPKNPLVLGDPNKYIIHIMPLEYDANLPKYYNNNHLFLWNRMDKHLLSRTKLFEKIEIEWFELSQIAPRIKEFRPFYQDVLKTHVLPAAAQIRRAVATTHTIIAPRRTRRYRSRSRASTR